MDGEEARIVDNNRGGEKFKSDECEKICQGEIH